MGSGLIYIIIVGMWIAYFLPRWIANHDEVSGKSVEKFALTMKVVGRTAGKSVIDIEEIYARRDHQIIVRRILFASTLALGAIVGIFIMVGFLSSAIMLIPISALGLFIVHARHQMSSLNEEIAQALAPSHEEKYVSKYSELIARSKRISASKLTLDAEQWTPLSERVAKSETESLGITIIPKGNAASGKGWIPISVPPPSYASAAKAVARIRKEAEESELQQFLRSTADEIFDQNLAEEAEAQIRINRAANE